MAAGSCGDLASQGSNTSDLGGGRCARLGSPSGLRCACPQPPGGGHEWLADVPPAPSSRNGAEPRALTVLRSPRRHLLGGARPHSSPANPSPCCSRHKHRPQTPCPGSVSRTPWAALPAARRFLHVCRHHWLRRPWPQLRTPPQACSADSPLPLSENDSPPATG